MLRIEHAESKLTNINLEDLLTVEIRSEPRIRFAERVDSCDVSVCAATLATLGDKLPLNRSCVNEELAWVCRI
jgi:hypothetical protein